MTHFSDSDINMPALRQRAFNLRWATLPEDVIPLTAADPDFRCAPEIVQAINDYSAERTFAYGPAEGLRSFREVIARTVGERKNIQTTADLVLPVDSAAQGMFVVAKYCLQPGDEAIIFDPVDFLFKTSVEAAGGKAVLFPVDVATGKYDLDRLRSLVTPRTKMLCLCNPHNPIGKVYNRAELQELGNFAVEHDLWIMNDEIWSDIVFPHAQFTSMASISPEISERTLTVYGFSKSFGLAGLRVGYIISPSAMVHEGIIETSMVRTTAFGVSTVSQVAAQAAYEHCWYWVEEFIAHLTKNKNYAVSRLNQMPGVRCHQPQGCYLVFPDIRETGLNGTALADLLLKKGRVAVVPGAEKWFGPGASGHLRLCIATSHSILKEGLDRMEQTLLRR
ncbi:MAG TPA: pyridoxal phosphate-dependent aminotransferase [Chitinophagaceae bacterium]